MLRASFVHAWRSESASALCWITEDYAERKLILEPARFTEDRRHIRRGSGPGGDSGCPGAGRASACGVCRYPAGYTLSQALHHHAILAAEARLCRAGRLRRCCGDADYG